MSDDVIGKALKLIPYGYYAVTTHTDDDDNVMVATWMFQCSFSPRQFAVAIQSDCYSHGLIEQGGVFTVNIFHKDNADAIKGFTKGRDKDPEKMQKASFSRAPQTQCPIMDGAAAYIECRMVSRLDSGGDHEIFVGEVVGGDVLSEQKVDDTLSLMSIGWSYAG